jgi:hypothetical protein
MSTFNPQTVENVNGAVPVFAAVSASDILTNNGLCILHVKNAGGSVDNVSIAGVSACSHGQLHALTFSVGAGLEFIVGPFPLSRFGAAPVITHSFVTSVTAGLFQLIQ